MESNNKCPYCHPDAEDYVKANGAFWIYEDRHNGWLIHAGKCKPQPINYCPMCGKKLERYRGNGT